MPYLQLNPSSKPLPAIWNVTSSVGKGGVNQLDDIYLVQYMLKMVGKAGLIPGQATLCKKLSQILMTGNCDTFTISCITDYQTMLAAKNPVTVDGRVSRSTASYSYGTGGYTIVYLNYDYKAAYWSNWPCIDLDSASRPMSVRELCYGKLYGKDPLY